MASAPIARVSYGNYLIHPFVLFALVHAYREVAGPAPGKEKSFYREALKRA